MLERAEARELDPEDRTPLEHRTHHPRRLGEAGLVDEAVDERDVGHPAVVAPIVATTNRLDRPLDRYGQGQHQGAVVGRRGVQRRRRGRTPDGDTSDEAVVIRDRQRGGVPLDGLFGEELDRLASQRRRARANVDAVEARGLARARHQRGEGIAGRVEGLARLARTQRGPQIGEAPARERGVGPGLAQVEVTEQEPGLVALGGHTLGQELDLPRSGPQRFGRAVGRQVQHRHREPLPPDRDARRDEAFVRRRFGHADPREAEAREQELPHRLDRHPVARGVAHCVPFAHPVGRGERLEKARSHLDQRDEIGVGRPQPLDRCRRSLLRVDELGLVQVRQHVEQRHLEAHDPRPAGGHERFIELGLGPRPRSRVEAIGQTRSLGEQRGGIGRRARLRFEGRSSLGVGGLRGVGGGDRVEARAAVPDDARGGAKVHDPVPGNVSLRVEVAVRDLARLGARVIVVADDVTRAVEAPVPFDDVVDLAARTHLRRRLARRVVTTAFHGGPSLARRGVEASGFDPRGG